MSLIIKKAEIINNEIAHFLVLVEKRIIDTFLKLSLKF